MHRDICDVSHYIPFHVETANGDDSAITLTANHISNVWSRPHGKKLGRSHLEALQS